MIYLLGISGNIKLISVWTYVRITNFDAPSIIHRKPGAVLLSHESAKRRRNISKPAWTNGVISLPLCSHAMMCSERTPRYCSTTKPCRKFRQEIKKVLFRNFELQEVKDEHCNCKSHTSMYPRITYPHEPNEPSSSEVRWSRPQPISCTIRRTINISQNGTKGFRQKMTV